MTNLSQDNSRKIFIIVAVSLFSAFVGYSLIKIMESDLLSGEWFSENSLVQEEGEGQDEEQESDESSTDPDLQPGWQSYSGIIDVAQDAPGEATHVLTDENGEAIIYLTAVDEKLVVSESLDAEVQGPVSNLKDSDKRLMQVERVVFE